MAIRVSVEPTIIGFDGEIVIEARFGKARLEGWKESVLDKVTPLLMPPTNNTLPSVNRVAV